MAESDARLGDWKMFNDPLHGQIKIHPVIVQLIDTVEFQRLRGINGIGYACYLVFPGAAHNVFEHSIGVAYLAGELLKYLVENAKECRREDPPKITELDILCVQIAGLCRNLGVGPLSRVFDMFLVDQVPEESGEDYQFLNERWRAMKIFSEMCEKPHIRKSFETTFGEELEKNIIFIKEMILGRPLNDEGYKGRPASQRFLYKVIGEPENGVDVCCWDYLARDNRDLNIVGINYIKRFLQCAQVSSVQTSKEESGAHNSIILRDKLQEDLHTMFFGQHTNHRIARQHKTVIALEYMLLDLLKLAKDVALWDENGRKFTLTDCCQKFSVSQFLCLKDSIMDIIKQAALQKGKCKHEEVKQLWERINTRTLYRVSDVQSNLKPKTSIPNEKRGNLVDAVANHAPEADQKWIKTNCIVHVVTKGYEDDDSNPLHNAHCYKKGKPSTPVLINESMLSREYICNRSVLLYVKDCSDESDERRNTAKSAFVKWSKPYHVRTTVQADETPEKQSQCTSSHQVPDDSNVIRRLNFPT